MARNIILNEEAVDVVDDIIEMVYEKIGIKLNTKELVEKLFQDPEVLSNIIVQNFKKRIVAQR